MGRMSFHLGSAIGLFSTTDHEKMRFVGRADLTGKTVLEFIDEDDDDSVATSSWLAVINGATAVYVVVPSDEIQKRVEFVKYMYTPTCGESRIKVIRDRRDLPEKVEYDFVFDAPDDWSDGVVKRFNRTRRRKVQLVSTLALLDFEKEPKLDSLADGAMVMTDDPKKAVVAVFKGAQVQLKISDRFKSIRNFVFYNLPPILVSNIRFIPNF